jgi:hypothetical protein
MPLSDGDGVRDRIGAWLGMIRGGFSRRAQANLE